MLASSRLSTGLRTHPAAAARQLRLRLAALVLCAALLPTQGHITHGSRIKQPSRSLLQNTMDITASTLQPAEDGVTYTWVESLATALLGQGTPGMFWGTVPAADINTACQLLVDTGLYDIAATITAYGSTFSTSLSVTATGGCLAGDSSPVGTEMVLVDGSSGREVAIICTELAWDLGCSVYMTGPDVNSLADAMRATGSGRRLAQERSPTAVPTARASRAAGGRRLLQGGACGPSAGEASCNGQCCSNAGWCGETEAHCGSGCQSAYGICSTPPPSEGGSDGGSGGSSGGDSGATTTDAIACGAGTGGAVVLGGVAAAGCAALTIFAPLCLAGVAVGTAAVSVGSCAGEIAHAGDDGCFPAHATALLCDGRQARMDTLRLGDMLAVRKPGGSLGCEPIYAWGHRQRHATSQYVRLVVALDGAAAGASLGHRAAPAASNTSASASASATLELTASHFLPVLLPDGRITHKRAADVRLGDAVLAVWPGAGSGASQPALAPGRVVSISGVSSTGLYNPYTLGGNLVVNGVLASSHSAWFADVAFDAAGATAHLPAFYQAALAPARLLWRLLGRDAYLALYARLDAELDIASLCSAGKWGAMGTTYVMARALVAAAALLAARHVGTSALLASAVALAVLVRRESGHAGVRRHGAKQRRSRSSKSKAA